MAGILEAEGVVAGVAGYDAMVESAAAHALLAAEMVGATRGVFGGAGQLGPRLLALAAAVQAVNAALSAAASQCTLLGPPAVIDMLPDPSGALIYQCRHKTPHKWDLSGARLP